MKNIKTGKTGKTTEKYWRDRYALKEMMGNRTEDELLAHLNGLYKNALSEIDKEIEAFYGRYAKNNQLTLPEVKKRLDPKELKSAMYEISKYYSEIDKLARKSGKISVKKLREYKEILRLQSAKAYMSRLEDLKARIRHNIVKLAVQESEAMGESFQKESKRAYSLSAYELSKHVGFANIITDDQFAKIVDERWLGANYSERVWKDKARLEASLEKTFLQGVVRGQNPRKIAGIMHETLEDSINKDFVKSYYACERLARTEMIHILNESTFQSYRDYGVKKYEFICGEDERTCPKCSELDGQHFKLSEKIEGVTYPVIHPNCRCSTAPYFEKDEIDLAFEESEKVVRDEDGVLWNVSANMPYSEWMEKVSR